MTISELKDIMDAAAIEKDAALDEMREWRKKITIFENECKVAEIRKDATKLAELDAYAEECNPKIVAAEARKESTWKAYDKAFKAWANAVSAAKVEQYKREERGE